MLLFLVRHAETTANVAHIWQGQTDAPLSTRGIEQTHFLAQRLPKIKFDAVLSSDLGRTMTTAKTAFTNVEPDKAWREANVGTWEGLTIHAVMNRFPEQIRALNRGDLDVRLGGGETVGEFHARLEEAVAKTLKRFGPDSRVVVFSHGGAISGLLGKALHSHRAGFSRGISRIINTSVNVIDVPEDGVWKLSVFNDAQHLEHDVARLRNDNDRAGRHIDIHFDENNESAHDSHEELLRAIEATDANIFHATQNAAADVARAVAQVDDAERQPFLPLAHGSSLRVVKDDETLRLFRYGAIEDLRKTTP